MSIKEQVSQYQNSLILESNRPKIVEVQDTYPLRNIERISKELKIEELYSEVNNEFFDGKGAILTEKNNGGVLKHSINHDCSKEDYKSFGYSPRIRFIKWGIILPEKDGIDHITTYVYTVASKCHTLSTSWINDATSFILDCDGRPTKPYHYKVNCGIDIKTHIIEDENDGLIKSIVQLTVKSINLPKVHNWSCQESTVDGLQKPETITLGILNIGNEVTEEKKEEFKKLFYDALIVLGGSQSQSGSVPFYLPKQG